VTSTTGVILAAGRGSRLAGFTENRPKCLVELGGRSLLHWQTEALATAGVDPICIVTGYRREMIEATGYRSIVNPDWSESNMVASLLCATERLSPPLVVSYSDIVYSSTLVRRLVESPHDLAITYDREWKSLWAKRFRDPLSDAETFRIDDDARVREIGGKAGDIAEIQGQFMGLMKLSETAIGWITDLVASSEGARNRLDSTAMLMGLIDSDKPVYGVPTRGGWCEVDDPEDLAVAEQMLGEGLLGAPPRPGS